MIQKALDLGAHASRNARNMQAHERAWILEHLARELESQRGAFADLICHEAKKPITLARTEVDRAIFVLRFAAGEALRWSGDLIRLDAMSGGRSGWGITERFPRGLGLGITPFNFPLNLMVHKIAPALAVGNAVIIKPSPFTPQTALRFAELLPEEHAHLVQVILATDEETAKLTQASEIHWVSFTGSDSVGRLIREQSSKPLTLELGGNAWAIVAEDARESDLPLIAHRIARGAFSYAGQSCVSVQNIAVHVKHAAALEALLTQETQNFPYGPATDPSVLCGPVIHGKAFERITQLMTTAEKTARSSVKSMTAKGAVENLIAPTLFLESELTPTPPHRAPWMQEEAFAPLATLMPYRQTTDVIQQINSSRYGLQAGLFTNDLQMGHFFFKNLEVGGLVINDVPTSRVDHQPYGGLKDSGEGREGIRAAMYELTQTKFMSLSSEIPIK